MHAQDENSGLSVEGKVASEKNGYFVSGQFDYFVPISVFFDLIGKFCLKSVFSPRGPLIVLKIKIERVRQMLLRGSFFLAGAIFATMTQIRAIVLWGIEVKFSMTATMI